MTIFRTKQPNEKEFLNLSETAEFLGCSRPMVLKMAEEKKIPHRKEGRRYFFYRKALEEWGAGDKE